MSRLPPPESRPTGSAEGEQPLYNVRGISLREEMRPGTRLLSLPSPPMPADPNVLDGEGALCRLRGGGQGEGRPGCLEDSLPRLR